MGRANLDLVVQRNRRPWLILGTVGMILMLRYSTGLGAGGAAVSYAAKGGVKSAMGGSLVSRTVRDAFVRFL